MLQTEIKDKINLSITLLMITTIKRREIIHNKIKVEDTIMNL